MANHDVTIEGQVVRKRYGGTNRDEPAREWAALVLLHEHAPGLAPQPLARETDPPAVVMSRVAGDALDAVLTPRLLASMVEAYRTLFAVPLPPDTPRRFWHPAAFLLNNVAWLEEEHARPGLPDVVRRALVAARTWHAGPPPGLDRIHDPVLAQGDGKVDNMLWDGSRVRLVDFEGSGVGDLAFEVADLAEHISARLRGLRDPEAVVAAFDLSPAQRARAEAYRIVLATFWLLMLRPGNRGHRLNPEGSDRDQAEHLLDLLGRSAG
ncbi:aminoglycoside phosphotransferase family protein [Nocardioides sp. cx-169]|uniref:aminoglycoside phosphotransferase family protein n=1 Tax=Nocardioides sp. cx-169 TaxID=2899080 RepID=UPI001E2DAEBF|nr:aminoglycoside phosphotransferase family protein [Nocardioides sp. cx-169]MCD4536544.1 aminoglycoside phosphotransferase family protein [Nocardioides sp. cx-169]